MKTEPNEPINFVQLPRKANERGVIIEYDNLLGLTKREYLAGLAIQGLLAHLSTGTGINYDDIAQDSILCADALINAPGIR